MPSEIFTGHTFTKIKNLVKKGVAEPVVYRDGDTKGLAVKVTKTGASWFFSTRNFNFRIAPFSAFGLAERRSHLGSRARLLSRMVCKEPQ